MDITSSIEAFESSEEEVCDGGLVVRIEPTFEVMVLEALAGAPMNLFVSASLAIDR